MDEFYAKIFKMCRKLSLLKMAQTLWRIMVCAVMSANDGYNQWRRKDLEVGRRAELRHFFDARLQINFKVKRH
jgi:hypothetical protein